MSGVGGRAQCAWRGGGEASRNRHGSQNRTTGQPGYESGPCVHFDVSGTLPFLSSEFSSALEYLKLLTSFVDSVGIVSQPFSSSSVLKSALGKHLAGWHPRPQVLVPSLTAPCPRVPGSL